MDKSTIEQTVMRRVHLIHALRFAMSGGFLSIFVTILSLWGIGRQVWVARVLQNAPANPIEVAQFYFSAFLHTGIAVQILTVAVLISLVFLAREIAKAIMVIRTTEST